VLLLLYSAYGHHPCNSNSIVGWREATSQRCCPRPARWQVKQGGGEGRPYVITLPDGRDVEMTPAGVEALSRCDVTKLSKLVHDLADLPEPNEVSPPGLGERGSVALMHYGHEDLP
jgi:hypothetical protein